MLRETVVRLNHFAWAFALILLSHIFDPCLYSWSRSFLFDPLFILLGTESFDLSLEIARLILVDLFVLPLLHFSGCFDDLRVIRSSPLLFFLFLLFLVIELSRMD